MADLVNDYFKQFYPKSLDRAKFEFHDWLGGMWEYTDKSVRTIFPKMVCNDGFSMSVQGHYGAYSFPRDDFAERYSRVEVWCLSEEEPLLIEWDRKRGYGEPNRGEEPYGGVPVELVEQIVIKHGGLRNG